MCKHTEMRTNWLSKLKLPENFPEIEASEKLKIVLNEAENVKLTGQFIIDAFNYLSKLVKNDVKHFTATNLSVL